MSHHRETIDTKRLPINVWFKKIKVVKIIGRMEGSIKGVKSLQKNCSTSERRMEKNNRLSRPPTEKRWDLELDQFTSRPKNVAPERWKMTTEETGIEIIRIEGFCKKLQDFKNQVIKRKVKVGSKKEMW